MNQNYFLLKYFKFECSVCAILCSHVLISDCCKTSLCLCCAMTLCDSFAS